MCLNLPAIEHLDGKAASQVRKPSIALVAQTRASLSKENKPMPTSCISVRPKTAPAREESTSRKDEIQNSARGCLKRRSSVGRGGGCGLRPKRITLRALPDPPRTRVAFTSSSPGVPSNSSEVSLLTRKRQTLPALPTAAFSTNSEKENQIFRVAVKRSKPKLPRALRNTRVGLNVKQKCRETSSRARRCGRV